MMDLPNFAPLRVTQKPGRCTRADIDNLDHLLIILPRKRQPSASGLPLRGQIERLARLAARRPDHTMSTRLNNTRATQLTVALSATQTTTFARLTRARKLIGIAAADGGRLGVIAQDFAQKESTAIIHSLLAAASAASFPLPSYKTERAPRRITGATILGAADRIDVTEIRAAARANNMARWLAVLPPNELNAVTYREAIKKIAARPEMKVKFLGEAALAKLGAGAFLAVSQGNNDREAGIVHIRYEPKNSAGHLCLVGKGIIFDTGGNNLKPFTGMLDMHMDMQGSAVVLGVLVALADLKVPYRIDAWLAISENRISATAYKSQDVVTAVNGTTIQVIHTDAEGRMVLADTLAIAAREKPDLIIDYATLTGACVTAVTTSYSGVFTNRPTTHNQLIEAGKASGERVWPFPLDEEFDSRLESPVADIRQCAEDGAGDHILAARFLQRFVPASIPWIHMDLSASQHKGGLAHVATDCTGFGARFSLELLERQLDFRHRHSQLPST